jgi:hypothetical protein
VYLTILSIKKDETTFMRYIKTGLARAIELKRYNVFKLYLRYEGLDLTETLLECLYQGDDHEITQRMVHVLLDKGAWDSGPCLRNAIRNYNCPNIARMLLSQFTIYIFAGYDL